MTTLRAMILIGGATAAVLLGLVCWEPIPAARADETKAAASQLLPDGRLNAAELAILQALSEKPLRTAWNPAVNDERVRGVSEKIYARVAPATVVVYTGNAMGSGFLIDPEGWLVTNRHVISDTDTDPKTGAQKARIYLGDLGEGGQMILRKESRPAHVYKFDASKDLALLKLARLPADGKKLPSIAFARAEPRVGMECVQLGHPSTGLLWTVRSGEVSGIGTYPHDFKFFWFQRLALEGKERDEFVKKLDRVGVKRKAILSSCGGTHGDSGGPLVDENGELRRCWGSATPATLYASTIWPSSMSLGTSRSWANPWPARPCPSPANSST